MRKYLYPSRRRSHLDCMGKKRALPSHARRRAPGSRGEQKQAKRRKKGKRGRGGGGGGNDALMAASARAAAAAAALSSGSHKKKKKKKKKHKKERRQSKEKKEISRGQRKEAGAGASHGSTESGMPSRNATRAPLPFRPPNISPSTKYLTPQRPSPSAFKQLHRHSYRGLVFDTASALPTSLHDDVTAALDSMFCEGLFHRDIVQAGRNVSATFVDRTLLGDPGMTYFYQRLRIFAHPWDDAHTSDGSPFRTMRKLNEALKVRTRALAAADPTSVKGKTDFNITLINRMDSLRDANSGEWPLRAESQFGLGDASVSWHADSSLQDFSSIAIYHQIESTRGARDNASWAVAARVIGDDKTPAIKVHLKDRQTYYMLNDFNHYHHHAVIAGNVWRYSSTHRVGIVAKDTLSFVMKNSREGKQAYEQTLRRLTVLSGSQADRATNVSHDHAVELRTTLRRAAEAHLVLEFDWLRMFWIQGQKHADAHHAYWKPHMATLHSMWSEFEVFAMKSGLMLLQSMIVLEEKVEEARTENKSIENNDAAKNLLRCASIYVWFLKELQAQRLEFSKRRNAKAYAKLPPDERPLDLPPARTEPGEEVLDDLQLMISEVGKSRAALMKCFERLD
eukprot:g3524.t1